MFRNYKPTVLLTLVLMLLLFGCEGQLTNPAEEEAQTKDYLEYGSLIKGGLVAYYPFDGDALDYSGNEIHGVFSGDSSSPGRFGQKSGALNFNGVDDFVRIPGFKSVNGDSGTVCFWVRKDVDTQTDKQEAIVAKIDTAGVGYVISSTPSYGCWFMYGDYTGSKDGRALPRAWGSFWEYGFVAFVFEVHKTLTTKTTITKIYIDGILNEVTQTITPSPEGLILYPKWNYGFNTNNQELYIGKSLLSNYCYFKGDIDDILVYDRVLSKEELTQLLNWE